MEAYAAANQVYAAGLIFARIAAVVMLIPGLGEAFIPPRIRLAFALALALMLYPVVGGSIRGVPPEGAVMGGAVIREILIGMMIGGTLRLFMTSLASAGEIVSIQSTLSFAQTANPMQAQPSGTLATFLGLLGLVLIFSTNLHHLFLAGIYESFRIFPFGRDVPVADASELAVRTVGRSFALGVQLAAPVIVFSLVFNIATGLVGRVMPQFQVFFVATPLIVLLSLSIFALSLGVIGVVWIDRYRELAGTFAR